MRRLAAFILVLVAFALDAAAQIDSTRLRELDSRLEQYFKILEPEPVEIKNRECDALISAAKDSLLRQTIALKIYDHYYNSPVMGDEAVAIHLIDNWFSPGLVQMKDDRDLFGARFFAEFNRNSLIGMPAPEVTLLTPLGETVTIPSGSSYDMAGSSYDMAGSVPVMAGPTGHPRFRVLYFYDTDCAKCKMETAMLRSLLDDKDYPVDVCAVYVGREQDNWKRWRDSTFVVKAPDTRVIHLWDPQDESGFQMKYGLMKTPRMFLVDPDGVIVGRGLDTEALGQLLDASLEESVYEYGSSESAELFNSIFSLYGDDVKPEDVSDVAGMISGRTLSRGDTLGFKHLEGDLLYYLASHKTGVLREGTEGFIDSYILSREDIWNTMDDSLQVLGMAGMLKGLLSKAPVGSRIPRMPLKGWNRIRRKGGYIFFHVRDCSSCREQMALADSSGLRYLSVDMDEVGEKYPDTALRLLDSFDLSSLPYVMETGRRGVVLRRYLNLSERLSFFEEKE